MSITQIVKNSTAKVFRRAYIKRRVVSAGGGYESTWYEITDHVKKWGTIKYDMEDEKLATFKLSGINLVLRNDDGLFNAKSDPNSVWNGYASEYKTKFKIEAGYYDTDGSTLPTDPALFIGVLTDDIVLNAKNEATFKVKSLMSVFEDVSATRLTVDGTQKASDILTQIKNLVDSNVVSIFQQYISSTAWNIQTTTNVYPSLNTSTAIDMSCWDLMVQLAEAEGFGMWVTPGGAFHFADKDTNTTTAQFEFTGVGQDNRTYGHSIKEIESYKLAINKIYTRVRVQINEDDTSTSYRTVGENWNVGDSSTSYLYGERTYDFKNVWMNTATADALATVLQADLSTAKREIRMTTKFLPHLRALDRVSVNYVQTATPVPASLWDHVFWDSFLWSGGVGQNATFNIQGSFGIRSIEHDIDRFHSKFFIREAV